MAIFIKTVDIISTVLTIIILIRVLVSWYAGPKNAIYRFFDWLTRPFLAPLRRIIPRVGRLDFSPLVAIVIIQLINFLLFHFLR